MLEIYILFRKVSSKKIKRYIELVNSKSKVRILNTKTCSFFTALSLSFSRVARYTPSFLT